MVKYTYARLVVPANRHPLALLAVRLKVCHRCCRVIHTLCRIQSRQVINEDNQHRIKLSTDKHLIIGMHNLEQKHTTHCRMSRDTRLMMLGGQPSTVSIVPSNRVSVVGLCHKDEPYTRVRNKLCFRIVKGV